MCSHRSSNHPAPPQTTIPEISVPVTAHPVSAPLPPPPGGRAGEGRESPRGGVSSAIAWGPYQPRVAGLSGCTGAPPPGGTGSAPESAAVRGAVAPAGARSRAGGSRPSAAAPPLHSRAPRRRSTPACAGPSQPCSGSALSRPNSTTALTKNMPSAAGRVKESATLPAQATTTPETQKNAVTTTAPSRTPMASGQPARQPGDRGGDRGGRGRGERAHPEEGEVPAGGAPRCAGARRPAGVTGRPAAPRGRGRGAGRGRRGGRDGVVRVAAARDPGARVVVAAALALGERARAARASRAARRARGLSTTTTPTTSSTPMAIEQLRLAAGDRERDGAEGEQRRPEVHDQHRAAVRVADRQQPVVQVQLVRGERRLAAQAPPHDGHHQVDERDEQDRDRHRQRQRQRQQAGRGAGRSARRPGRWPRRRPPTASGRPASSPSRP